MSEERAIQLIGAIEATEDDLFQIVDAASSVGFDSPEQRGEKVWLYKAANQCANLVAKLEQIKGIREGKLPPISQTKATQEKYEKQLIEKAEAAAAERRKRLS